MLVGLGDEACSLETPEDWRAGSYLPHLPEGQKEKVRRFPASTCGNRHVPPGDRAGQVAFPCTDMW